MMKFLFTLRKFYSRALLLVGALVSMGASSVHAADIMRVSACGYKVGEETGVRQFSELPGLSVSPTDVVSVYSNSVIEASMQAVFTVKVPFGYMLSHWVKTFDDPNFSRTFGEKVAGSEGRTELTVRYETGGQWMYLAPVIVVDNKRTVTIAKSPFGEGTVGTNLGVYASQKGDVFKLAAVEKRDEKTGFAHSTFRRWENGSTDYERDAVVDSNDTFCAEFVPNSWTVTFDANGGEVFPTSKVVTCDATYGWLPTPTLTGSEFRGWKISQSSGGFVNKETKVGALGPHTLKAQWEKLRFSIEGKVSERCLNRGTVNGSGEYAYGSIANLTAVAYEGSQFEHWMDGLTDSTRRILVVSNATYTAEFAVRQCDVVFNYRGPNGQLLSVTRPVFYGDEAQPPLKEEYDSWAEHKFTSWDKDDWQKVTGNHVVTALYDMETFDVRFAYRGLDGNSVTTMPQHVETGKAATPPDDKVINNWRGMSFKGWDLDFSVVRSDLLVTAIYETNRYAIVFSYNDGEREVEENISLLHGETIPLDVYTAKANRWPGHDFKGWRLNGHEVQLGDVATESGTIAAVYEGYAKIVFAPGKGGGEMKPLVFTNFSGKVTLPPNAFTNEGYVFAQWVDASGEKHYDDGDEVSVVNGETQTLTAEWTPIEYFVTYDGNGGTIYGEDPGLTSASYDESFQLLNLFVDRPGHDFLGWCLDRQGNGEIYAQGALVKNLTNEAATVVLYAQWQEKNKYDIKVNTDGGDGKGTVTGGGSYYDGTNVVLTATPDTGSRFVQWQDGDTNATRTVAVASNVTYTAQFDKLRYDVVFSYTNSFEKATNFQAKAVAYGTAANPPSEDEYDRVPGRSFKCWSTEDYTNVVSDLEVVARYTNLLYVVACEANGDGHGTVTGTNTYEWGAKPLLKAAPDEGCEFTGWSDGITSPERTITVASNVTYGVSFARKCYQVKFSFRDANGDPTNETQTVFHGEPAIAPEVEGLWADHEFKGWEPSDFTKVTNNMTIAASYDSFAVIVYWPNGGTGEKKTISYPPELGATFESNDYTRVGYSPAGWASSAAGAKEYDDGAEIPVAFLTTGKTTDVYAVWSPIAYTLKFDANGGEGAPGEIACTYDQSKTIPDGAPTMTGYDFSYWAKERTGDSSVTYKSGDAYSNLTAVANEIVTLYARWDAQPPCKIVYHTNDGTGNATTQVVAIADAGLATFADGPARDGYDFVGWTNVNSTVVYKVADKIPSEYIVSDTMVDFYAKWKKADSELKTAIGLGGTDVEVTADAGWSASQDCVMCKTLQSKLTLKFTSAGMVTVSATIDNPYYFLAYQLGQGEEQYSTDNTLNLEQHVDKGSSLMLWQNNDDPDTMKVSASWTPDQQ